MDRRGFLGIMVFAAAGWFAGRGLVRRLRRMDASGGDGLKEAMFYKKE